MNLRRTCIVHVRRKFNIQVYYCSNSTVISLLNVVGKPCGRLLIERVWDGIESVIWEEHNGFTENRGLQVVAACEEDV